MNYLLSYDIWFLDEFLEILKVIQKFNLGKWQ